MKIRKQTENDLVIEDFHPFVCLMLSTMALFFAVGFIRTFALETFDSRRAVGTGLGFILLGFVAVVFIKKRSFYFNAPLRTLKWTQASLFGREQGEHFFDHIKDVIIESVTGSETSLNYRVAILTEKGTLPLSQSYQGSLEKCLSIAKEIQTFLGKDPSGLIKDSIQQMAQRGREMDAIKLARQEYQIDLSEAKELVQRLRTGK